MQVEIENGDKLCLSYGVSFFDRFCFLFLLIIAIGIIASGIYMLGYMYVVLDNGKIGVVLALFSLYSIIFIYRSWKHFLIPICSPKVLLGEKSFATRGKIYLWDNFKGYVENRVFIRWTAVPSGVTLLSKMGDEKVFIPYFRPENRDRVMSVIRDRYEGKTI